MKWLKRIAIAIGIIILLAILADVGVNAWIKHRLPKIINEKNQSPYYITYDDVSVSLFNRECSASGIVIVPKASVADKTIKAGLFGKIPRIDITGIHVWQLIFGDRIMAHDITVSDPEITLLKKNGKALSSSRSIGSKVVEPFSKIIYVDDVYLNHAALKITELNGNQRILDVKNLSVRLQGIKVDDSTLARKMPFRYRTYAIDCDSVFYKSGTFYHMVARRVATTNDGIKINGLKVLPNFKRYEFLKHLDMERDIYTILADSISIDGLRWGFDDDLFFLNAKTVAIDGANADIYRSKVLPDDPKKKKLYSELLRGIPFPMKVDTLRLRRSRIAYEEEIDYGKGPGKLTFSNFNLTATGIQSGFRQKKMPDVRIKVLCDFMQTSRLDVDWTFNVLDRKERFNIRGKFFHFPAQKLEPFTRPYLNATFKGDLDQVYFNFDGDDEGARGQFAINYDDLKVKIYRKNEPRKKHGLFTAIANLFVKNDTEDKVTNTDVDVHRAKDRSFFNLLWKSLEEGLKKILL